MNKGSFLDLTIIGLVDGGGRLGAVFYDGAEKTVGGYSRYPSVAVPIDKKNHDHHNNISSMYLRTARAMRLWQGLNRDHLVPLREIDGAFRVAAYHKVRAEVAGVPIDRGILSYDYLNRIMQKSGPEDVRACIKQHDRFGVYGR